MQNRKRKRKISQPASMSWYMSATVPCEASNSLIRLPSLDLPTRLEVMKPGDRCICKVTGMGGGNTVRGCTRKGVREEKKGGFVFLFLFLSQISIPNFRFLFLLRRQTGGGVGCEVGRGGKFEEESKG